MSSTVIVGGVFALLLVLIVAVLGRPRATFSEGTFAEVERAMQDKGLHICRTEDVPDGQANQAVESRRYDVGFVCASGDEAQVVVDNFAGRADRDAALRNFEVLVRPNGNGVTYSYKSFVIYVAGQSDDRSQDRIDEALRGLGAQ
ncbi:MAG TPA: hypothetical protein VH373_08830 [Jatrophihabitantaceae bacterium]